MRTQDSPPPEQARRLLEEDKKRVTVYSGHRCKFDQVIKGQLHTWRRCSGCGTWEMDE